MNKLFKNLIVGVYVVFAAMTLLRAEQQKTTEENGMTPLTQAAAKGDLDRIKRLLKEGEKIDSRDKDLGLTPLMWAVRKGQLDTAKFLLENGADVNLMSVGSTSVLMWAVEEDKLSKPLEMVKLLLDKGAKVNEIDEGGHTALMTAITRNYPDVVSFLVGKGTDVNVVEKTTGNNALMLALVWLDGGKAETLAILKALIEKTKDLNVQGYVDGQSALHTAVFFKRIESAKLLVKAGADINLVNHSSGHTPLHMAVMSGNEEMVKFLVDSGADVKKVDYYKRTPLECVKGFENRKGVAEILKKAGAK